jgi:arsenate reductase
MAEGFAKELGKTLIEVKSAGTEEGNTVDPTAIEVMSEKEIDISNQYSKVVESWVWADRIIVMGCDAEDSCPISYLHKLENWNLENPKGKPISEYRRIRDQIEKKITDLIHEYRN